MDRQECLSYSSHGSVTLSYLTRLFVNDRENELNYFEKAASEWA
jgi:hypothetical protein